MDYIGSIIIYFALFILAVLMSIVLEHKVYFFFYKRKRLHVFFLLLFILLPLIMLALLRDYSVGVDTGNYVKLFYHCKELKLYQVFKENNEDFLYNIMIWFFAHTCKKPYLFLGFMQLIVLYPIMVVALYSSKYNIRMWQMLLMYCLWYFNDSLNLMRQMVAVAFFLLAVFHFFDDNKVHAIIAIIVGAGFHKSILLVVGLGIVVYYLYKKNSTFLKKTVLISAVVSVFYFGQEIFVYLMRIGILPIRYDFYVRTFFYNTTNVSQKWISVGKGAIFEMIIRIFILLFSIYKSKNEPDKRYFEIMRMYYFLNILIYSIGVLGYRTTYFMRISLYFDICGLLLLACLDYNEKTKVKIGRFRIPFVVVLSVFYWYFHTVILGSGGTYPYRVFI